MRATAGNRFERHPIRTAIGLAVATLATIEVGVRILVGFDVLPYAPFRTTATPVFWADDHPSFGTWHLPNAAFHHETSCFDVTYRSNSYGARDRERERNSSAPRRTVVLGDSFAEGLGVESEERVSDLLERDTQIEHLNFGTSGNFGSVQEWVQYRDMVRQFDHTDVILLVLPDNDFLDNNPAESPAHRYRPYLIAGDDGFHLTYRVAFEDRDRDRYAPAKILQNFISNISYTLNVTRHVLRHRKQARRWARSEVDRVPYNDFTDLDLRIMLESYRRLRESMGDGRRLWIFTIPRFRDFAWYQANGYDFRLPAALSRFAASEVDVAYLDLLPGIVSRASELGVPIASLFHECDGHWSKLGNQIAADIIRTHVYGDRPATGNKQGG